MDRGFRMRWLREAQRSHGKKVRFALDSPVEEEDSNSRSLREGKGCGQPLQASIAVSDLNL